MPETTEQAPPSTETQSAPQSEFTSFDSEIDSLAGIMPGKQETPKTDEKKTEEKPAEPAEAKKPEEKKPEEKKPEEKKPEVKKEEEKYQTSKELRAALDKAKEEKKALQAELEKIKTAKPPEDTEKRTLAEQLESERKKREELETSLKFTKFEQTEEYKEKYEKPLINAFQSAHKDLSDFDFVDDDGNTRKATSDDFMRFLNLTPKAASKFAEERFGDGSNILMIHRDKILERENERRAAIEDFKAKGSEREKTRQAEMVAMREKLQTTYTSTIKDMQEKYPDLFTPEEGNEEDKAILDKGYQLADAAFNGSNIPPEKKAQLHAAIRMKAGAFDRVVIQNRKLSDRIKALEDELKSLQSSTPGEGDEKKDTATPSYVPFEDEIDMVAGKR